MWPTLFGTAISVAAAWFFARGIQSTPGKPYAVVPNNSGQGAPVVPGFTGLATAPTAFIASQLPANPFSQPIRDPKNIAFQGYYTPNSVSFMPTDLAAGSPGAKPDTGSQCGCGGDCCDSGCMIGGQYSDGRGGCMSVSPGRLAATFPNGAFNRLYDNLVSSGAIDPLGAAQQSQFDAETASPGFGVPAAPARRITRVGYQS